MPEPTGVRVTQVGSWPGTDFASAMGMALEETPDLPCLPELPDRGPGAGMIGRAAGLITEIPMDLQPTGWRIASGSARDQRVARSYLRSDLDQLEEAAQGYQGPVKISFIGPWSLAASVERNRGDKVLGDLGARKELAEALAEGLVQLGSDLANRLPEISVLWQLDEPMLALVADGRIATASGYSRMRPVEAPDLVSLLDLVMTATGDNCWLHSCAADLPWDTLLRTQATGLSVDASLVSTAGWDALGPSVEQGRSLALGVLATSGPVPSTDQVSQRVLRRWESLGLDQTAIDRLWLTPTCGLAGRSEAEALTSLRTLRTAADLVTEQVNDR